MQWWKGKTLMEPLAAANAGPGPKATCSRAFSNAFSFLAALAFLLHFAAMIWVAFRICACVTRGVGWLIRTQKWKGLHRSLGICSVTQAGQHWNQSRQTHVDSTFKDFSGQRSKPPSRSASFSFQPSWKAKHFFLLPNQTFPDCNTSSLTLVYEIQNYMLITWITSPYDPTKTGSRLKKKKDGLV